jgi:hypothetical protein
MTESELAQPPDEVAELAEACVRFVKDALGLTLDYTPETLPILDHYMQERVAGAKPEIAELIAPSAGAYFGEVVRRTLPGAHWHSPGGEYSAYRLEFEPFFLCFNPIGVAMEVLAVDDVPGVGANFQVLDEARPAVHQALEQNEMVRPEDYYTFSMRLEVLHQVADVLSGLESAQPTPRRFGPEVYAAASGRKEPSAPPS